MQEQFSPNKTPENSGIQKTCLFQPIGSIQTPHHNPSLTPIQPVFAKGVRGTVELFPEYADGLQDLDGFSHIYLFYFFDRAGQAKMKVRPYLESNERGIFATRSPQRPNRLGMSLVRLIGINGTVLEVEDIDVLDTTPLLDIKPYIFRFDSRDEARSGWQENIPDEIAVRVGGRKDQTEKSG